ncbi:MAG: hypothetical protein WC479_05750 [Candidatus Izemoplasmatales bacterium]
MIEFERKKDIYMIIMEETAKDGLQPESLCKKMATLLTDPEEIAYSGFVIGSLATLAKTGKLEEMIDDIKNGRTSWI